MHPFFQNLSKQPLKQTEAVKLLQQFHIAQFAAGNSEILKTAPSDAISLDISPSDSLGLRRSMSSAEMPARSGHNNAIGSTSAAELDPARNATFSSDLQQFAHLPDVNERAIVSLSYMVDADVVRQLFANLCSQAVPTCTEKAGL